MTKQKRKASVKHRRKYKRKSARKVSRGIRRKYKRKTTRKGSRIRVKRKFNNAMRRLHRLKGAQQRVLVKGASNEFIRDVSGFLKKIRGKSHLVKSARHRNTLKRHRKKLQKLVHAKTPLDKKRKILLQRGGIAPLLIPIIVAIIGAGGGVASAATHAAISRA